MPRREIAAAEPADLEWSDVEDEREREHIIHRLYTGNRQAAINRVKEAQALQPLPGSSVMADDAERRHLFLSEVGTKLTAKGTEFTVKWLWRVYRISRRAARLIVSEARRELADQHRATVMELRGLASARLEDALRRARLAGDLNEEVKILKEWMRLHGLYAAEDQGALDLASIIRRISAAEGAGALPQGKVIEADFTVKDDDGEEEPAEQSWAIPEEWEPLVDEGSADDEDEEEAAL